MLPACLKTGSFGGLLWRGRHLFLTLKLHGPGDFSFYHLCLERGKSLPRHYLFLPISLCCNERELHVCSDGSGGRWGWWATASFSLTWQATSADLTFHKHLKGEVSPVGNASQPLSQLRQRGRVLGLMTWKKSEVTGCWGMLPCRWQGLQNDETD